jgi:hypothetical protein
MKSEGRIPKAEGRPETNPKAETRRPKEVRIPKPEIRRAAPMADLEFGFRISNRLLAFSFGHSAFGFRASFGLRPSEFGLE